MISSQIRYIRIILTSPIHQLNLPVSTPKEHKIIRHYFGELGSLTSHEIVHCVSKKRERILKIG